MKLTLKSAPSTLVLVGILAISTVFLAALAWYHLGVSQPFCRKLTALQSEILKRERNLSLSATLASHHPETLRRLRINDSSMLESIGVVNPAVEFITKSAKKHGLELRFMEPGHLERVGKRRRTPLSLKLGGTYESFLAWMHAVESSDVLLTVDRVFIERSDSGTHNFHISISTFTYRQRS